MKLSMICTNIITKYRYSSRIWKSGKSVFQSFNQKPFIGQIYIGVLGVCRPTCLNRNLHSSLSLKAKSHQEKENEYAHSIMEDLPSYAGTVVKYPLGRPSFQSSSEIVKQFSEASLSAHNLNLSLENSKFNQLLEALSQSLPNLSDQDLVQVLHCLCLWPPSPKSFSRNFKLIWNSLDFECCNRLKGWDCDRKLLIADYWFYLRLNRITQYNWNLLSNLLGNIHTLSNQQVVQLTFYINLQRNVPPSHQHALQKRLLSLIEVVSLEEIGIICIGFFKTKSKVDNFDIIRTIIGRFSSEMDQVNTVTVAAVLKFLRKSMHLLRTESYVPLLHKCVSCIPKWDIPTSIHSALLSSECHVYHPLLLDTVTRKVGAKIGTARIKDCTKLLQCLSHFNHYAEPEFHQRFQEELKKDCRMPEIVAYPRDLAYTCLFYAYLGHYNHDLLHTTLDPVFVKDCCEKFPTMENALAEIDYCVGVECRDYTGPRLPKEQLVLLRSRRGNLPSESNNNLQTRLLVEIVDTLEGLVEKENVLVRHILPHFFSPDIVVRLSGRAEPLSDVCANVMPEEVLIPPPDETWACFVATTSFSFAYKSKHLTGSTAMKLRQLRTLGYKTICVPYFDLPTNSSLRKKYIHRKLEELETTCNFRLPVMQRK